MRELMKLMEAHEDAENENQTRASSSMSRSMQIRRTNKVGSARQGSRMRDDYTPDSNDTATDYYLQLPNIDSDDSKTDSMATMVSVVF